MLNQEEKRVIQKVVNEMLKCDLFSGIYDAKNGSESFMYGINTVIEHLAYLVSDRYGEEVCNTFIKNMIKSQEKT
jgi:hypothetical protein